MKSLCIDGYNLALGQGSGIATYGRNLLENARRVGLETQVLYGPAARLGVDDVLNEATLADAERAPPKVKRVQRFLKTATSRFGHTAQAIIPSGEVIWPARGPVRPAADMFWATQGLFAVANRSFQVYGTMTPVAFPSTEKASKPDAMQWTATLPLYAKSVANIYTFHDIIPIRLPHSTTDDKSVYLKLCKKIVDRADHIVVVSDTTKQDMIRVLGVSEDRISNTYQSVNFPKHIVDRPQSEIVTEIEGIFGLQWKGYFLHYGAIEPKKNLGRIIEAYLASGVQTPLVIIGGRAWLDGAETALLAQVKRDGGPSAQRIRQYEFMPFSLLTSLIRGAKATLFPSLYEGFGLPVLESMLLDTAVLTSTAGSLPEVSGDAALLVDPYDVAKMAKSIQALDADEGLRNELTARGRVRAKLFDEAAYQERLRDVYGRLGLV